MPEWTEKPGREPISYYCVLSPGKVLVDHGPVTMTIEARLGGQPFTEAAVAGAGKVLAMLNELVECLPAARRAVAELDPSGDHTYPEVLCRMTLSVRRLEEADFTPMAAVAGTFSDMVKEVVVDAGSDHVIVNNGGDIAVHIGPAGAPFRVGIISDLATGRVTHRLNVFPGMGVGGIATSGLGGRSLTKGVASAVTVVAENGSLADAAATAISNATNCNDPGVERCPAEELDHLTDIRGHLVTRQVGILTGACVEEALLNGVQRTRELCRQGMIIGAVLFVQGRVMMWPDKLVQPLL